MPFFTLIFLLLVLWCSHTEDSLKCNCKNSFNKAVEETKGKGRVPSRAKTVAEDELQGRTDGGLRWD